MFGHFQSFWIHFPYFYFGLGGQGPNHTKRTKPLLATFMATSTAPGWDLSLPPKKSWVCPFQNTEVIEVCSAAREALEFKGLTHFSHRRFWKYRKRMEKTVVQINVLGVQLALPCHFRWYIELFSMEYQWMHCACWLLGVHLYMKCWDLKEWWWQRITEPTVAALVPVNMMSIFVVADTSDMWVPEVPSSTNTKEKALHTSESPRIDWIDWLDWRVDYYFR